LQIKQNMIKGPGCGKGT